MLLDRRPDDAEIELLERLVGDRALRVADRDVAKAPARSARLELADPVRRPRWVIGRRRAARPIATLQVVAPVTRGRIGPDGVRIANSSRSVWPRRRRYMIASREPFPESPDSEPSGLKIRRLAT